MFPRCAWRTWDACPSVTYCLQGAKVGWQKKKDPEIENGNRRLKNAAQMLTEMIAREYMSLPAK